MRSRSIVEKFFFYCSVIGLGLSVAGTRACQQSYNVAAQLQSTPVATVTETPTITPTDLPTDTPIPEPTDVPTAIVTPIIVVVTATPVPVVTANALLSTLSSLATRTAGETNAHAAAAQVKNENWLGQDFSSSSSEGAAIDSDGDGFADWFELKMGSDPHDPHSTPNFTPHSRLADRVGAAALEEYRAVYEVTRAKELALGLCQNGAAWAPPADGSDPGFVDSDCDGLPDDVEVQLGTDPHNGDTDGDGIMDGAEVELGSDPAIPDY